MICMDCKREVKYFPREGELQAILIESPPPGASGNSIYNCEVCYNAPLTANPVEAYEKVKELLDRRDLTRCFY